MPSSDWRHIAEGPRGLARAAQALLMPAVLYANTMRQIPAKESRLGENPALAGTMYCILSPLGALTTPLCVFPLNFWLRHHVYPEEAECRAATLSLCCAPCSLAEVSRELEKRKMAPTGPPREQRMSYGCDSKYCEL